MDPDVGSDNRHAHPGSHIAKQQTLQADVAEEHCSAWGCEVAVPAQLLTLQRLQDVLNLET